MTNYKEEAERFRSDFVRLREEVGKIIVGHDEVVEGVLIGIFCGGHCLLEGVPGLGKTLLVRALSQALDVTFSRIQFTPDLMPADIIGTNIVVEDEGGRRTFRFQKGPVFGNLILSDEINRATPKTQSALLEAMQEHAVTVGGVRHILQEPFYVMATQNPIEMEGTYPLPEAQLDRFFFKLLVNFPNASELTEIMARTTENVDLVARKVMDGKEVTNWQRLVRDVPIAPHVTDYAVRLTLATHPASPLSTEKVRKYMRYGASPRGTQALVLSGKVRSLLAGRFNVGFKDIQTSIGPALRHRIILNFEAEAEGMKPDAVLEDLLERVPVGEA